MGFFRDTSINNKILIPPIIMVVALGAVLLIAIQGFSKQGSVLSQVHDIALERTTLVNEFISLSESVQSDLFRIAVLRYMNLPDREIQPIYENLELGLSNLGVMYGHILNKWLLDQKEKEILEQMRVPMDAFSQEAQQATAVVSQNPSFGILLVRSAAVPFAGFRILLKEFLNYQKEKIVQAETISKQTVDTVKTTATAIALFTAFMAILITVWIGTRLISRPVRSITEVMDQLASGDLSAKVADLRRRDEIGSMAKAVEVFRKNAIEKQATEEALRKEKDKAQKYLDIAGVMFVAINADGEVTLVNKKGCEILGYDESEIIGKNWFENFLPETIREEVISVSKKFLSGKIEAAEYYENPILTNRGQERLIAWHNSVLRDDGGNIVGHLSSGEDITEHKQIEETLRESEGKYRSLLDDVVDSSEVGLFILDSDFMIVWVNEALERYFGLQREDIIGKDKRRLIQEHIRHKFEDPGTFTETVLATYDNNIYVENFECHMLPDGERIDRWLEHWSRPIRSGLYAGGRVELYYDITERKLVSCHA